MQTARKKHCTQMQVESQGAALLQPYSLGYTVGIELIYDCICMARKVEKRREQTDIFIYLLICVRLNKDP